MVGENTRNTLVGLTMVAALGVLMYGIFMLGKSPEWGGLRPYLVTLNTPNANGVTAGAKVDLNGVVVGEVKSVELTKTNGMLRVNVVLQIEGKFDVPASASATLGKQQLGTPYVSLAVGQARGPILAKDDHAHLSAEPGDTGLIPQDVRNNLTSVTAQLGKVADDLHKLLAYNTPEEVEAAAKANPKAPNRPVENISTLVVRLNQTIKSVNELVGNRTVQSQIREVVDNLASASAQLKTTLGHVDALVSNADKTVGKFGSTADTASATLVSAQKEIVRISEKLVDTLGAVQTLTRQLSQGNGTTGKLIQDPRLYEGLVDLSKSMRGTVDDLDFLLKKWKDEGVNLKLK